MTDMVQCGMAVSGYPNMENIPPAQNYTAPPRVVVPPLQQHHHHHLHHHQPSGGGYTATSHRQQPPLSPNYPPPATPAAAATVFPQPRNAAIAGSGRVPSTLSPGPPPSSSAMEWSNGNNGVNSQHFSQSVGKSAAVAAVSSPLLADNHGVGGRSLIRGPHATL